MEINIEKLLESGMNPESIGKMVQLEAQKEQEKKNKKVDAEKLAVARSKLRFALWDYYVLLCPDIESIDKDEFVNILNQEISELEEVITSPMMQQIFKQPTSRCSCKEQTSESQKCVKNDEQKRTSRCQERTPRAKVSVEKLDEAAIDRLISDFVRTLM